MDPSKQKEERMVSEGEYVGRRGGEGGGKGGGGRRMKTLIARLTGRWLVAPEEPSSVGREEGREKPSFC